MFEDDDVESKKRHREEAYIYPTLTQEFMLDYDRKTLFHSILRLKNAPLGLPQVNVEPAVLGKTDEVRTRLCLVAEVQVTIVARPIELSSDCGLLGA